MLYVVIALVAGVMLFFLTQRGRAKIPARTSYGQSGWPEEEKSSEGGKNGKDKGLSPDAIKKAIWKAREKWLAPFIAFLGYCFLILALMWFSPPQVWSFWTSTKLFPALFLFVPLLALAMTKGGPAGKFWAVVIIVICVGTAGYDLHSYVKEHSPEQPMQTVKRQVPEVQRSAPGQGQITLTLGKWHDLRAEGLLLPNSNFQYSFFGCIEIAYDDEAARLQCDQATRPSPLVILSPSVIKEPAMWNHEGITMRVKVRGVSDGATIYISHS